MEHSKRENIKNERSRGRQVKRARRENGWVIRRMSRWELRAEVRRASMLVRTSKCITDIHDTEGAWRPAWALMGWMIGTIGSHMSLLLEVMGMTAFQG